MSWGRDDEGGAYDSTPEIGPVEIRRRAPYKGEAPYIRKQPRVITVKPVVAKGTSELSTAKKETFKEPPHTEELTGKRESELKVEKQVTLPWNRWRQASPYVFKFDSSSRNNEIGNHFLWTKLYKNAYVNNSGDFGTVAALKNSQFNMRVGNEDLFSDYVDLDAAFSAIYPLILPMGWSIPAGQRMLLLFRNALDGDIANTFEFYAHGYFRPDWKEPKFQPHIYVVGKNIQSDGNEFKVTVSKDRHFVLEKIGIIIRDSNFQHCEEYLDDGAVSSGRGILDQTETSFGAADEYTISLNVYTHNLHSPNQLINSIVGPMREPFRTRVFIPRGTYITGQINFPSQTSDIWLDLYFIGYFIFT